MSSSKKSLHTDGKSTFNSSFVLLAPVHGQLTLEISPSYSLVKRELVTSMVGFSAVRETEPSRYQEEIFSIPGLISR